MNDKRKTVQEVFKRVQRGVYDAGGGRQFPAVYDGLLGEFRFASAPGVAETNASGPSSTPPTSDIARQEELVYWTSIKDSRDPALFDEYLKRYGGNGPFAILARSRLAELRRPASATPAPVNPPAAAPPAAPAPTAAPAAAMAMGPAPNAALPAINPTSSRNSPQFQIDPSWPNLSDAPARSWPVIGVAVGSDDHVWISRQSLADGLAGDVLRLDPGGKVRLALGKGGQGFEWPESIRGLAIDRTGSVWIGGNGQNDTQILKFDANGRFLMQVGRARMNGGSNDTAGFRGPSKVSLDAATGEAYVADGFRNRRVVVIDMATGRTKRYWGAYGNKPDDRETGPYNPDAAPSMQFGNPVSCAEISKDGLVYVCDRINDRIQVFMKHGRFVKEVFVERQTRSGGSVWDIAFSPDNQQRFLYVADGTNGKVHILDRQSLSVLASIGAPGPNPGLFSSLQSVAVDSKGHLYTAESGDGRVGRVQKFVYKGLAR